MRGAERACDRATMRQLLLGCTFIGEGWGTAHGRRVLRQAPRLLDDPASALCWRRLVFATGILALVFGVSVTARCCLVAKAEARVKRCLVDCRRGGGAVLCARAGGISALSTLVTKYALAS